MHEHLLLVQVVVKCWYSLISTLNSLLVCSSCLEIGDTSVVVVSSCILRHLLTIPIVNNLIKLLLGDIIYYNRPWSPLIISL